MAVTLASLSSNRGHDSLVFEFLDRGDRDPGPEVDCRIQFLGSNWTDRDGPAPIRIDLGEHLSGASYSVGNTAGENQLTTDQSSIAEFVAGLQAALRAAWPAE